MLIDIGRSWRLSVYGCVGVWVCVERGKERAERNKGQQHKIAINCCSQILV